jgi:hypothetical protein
MLNVEEAPVVSVPVSVPVVVPDNWFEEPSAAALPVPAPAPAPARFLSEDEEEDMTNLDAAFFFSSATPVVATTVNVAPPPVSLDEEAPAQVEPEAPEPPARPRFAEMLEEPAFTQQPRDYAAEFGSAAIEPVEPHENPAPPSTPLFSEPGVEEQRDLDIPAIMRRLRF